MLNAAWFASATVPSGPITHSGVGAISIAADRVPASSDAALRFVWSTMLPLAFR
ncbi:MAG: hypothetical protein K0R33_2149 [Mycobacterium sp.]|nr:hypothetical protein [Mycobacterium sp.]